MLNKTSSYYKPNKIDFTVMGFDREADEFLNWCMEQRDNLEFIRECKTLEKASQASVLHADHLMNIRKIEDVVIHKRRGLTSDETAV